MTYQMIKQPLDPYSESKIAFYLVSLSTFPFFLQTSMLSLFYTWKLRLKYIQSPKLRVATTGINKEKSWKRKEKICHQNRYKCGYAEK